MEHIEELFDYLGRNATMHSRNRSRDDLASSDCFLVNAGSVRNERRFGKALKERCGLCGSKLDFLDRASDHLIHRGKHHSASHHCRSVGSSVILKAHNISHRSGCTAVNDCQRRRRHSSRNHHLHGRSRHSDSHKAVLTIDQIAFFVKSNTLMRGYKCSALDFSDVCIDIHTANRAVLGIVRQILCRDLGSNCFKTCLNHFSFLLIF